MQARHQREIKILTAARALQKLNGSNKRMSKQTMESLEQSEKKVEAAEKVYYSSSEIIHSRLIVDNRTSFYFAIEKHPCADGFSNTILASCHGKFAALLALLPKLSLGLTVNLTSFRPLISVNKSLYVN